MRWLIPLLTLGLYTILSSACAEAPRPDRLAVRAVVEAISMPPGSARDSTLQTVSRNLRHAERVVAIEAAAAMSDDTELRSFLPGTDEVTGGMMGWIAEQQKEADRCSRAVASLQPGRAGPSEEAMIRACFNLDGPYGIDPPPLKPFAMIVHAATALPPGRTRAELLHMATWHAVPGRPAGGAREAARGLRNLRPMLDEKLRTEVDTWLETTEIAWSRRRRSRQQSRHSGTWPYRSVPLRTRCGPRGRCK
jgi:hypothetical protein